MDDKTLLEAIGHLMETQEKKLSDMMDTKLQQFGTEVDAKLARQKTEIMHEVNVLLENVVVPRFNLLAEGQEDILRRMPNEDDMDIIDGRLSDLESDVALLKKAN